jgi:hypothetical protein
MASEQPYNALGQILSGQGEMAVGLAILQKGGAGGALAFISKKFGFLGDDERDALFKLSESMVAAGATVNQLPPGTSINLNDVPLNPFLFGGDLEGRRSLFTGEVEIPGAEHRVQIRLPFTDVPSIDELREAFLSRALEIAGQYPGKFGLPVGSPMVGGQVYILLPERAF